MNKEVKQNDRGGFLTNKKEILWTSSLSLSLVLLFELFFSYNPNAPLWGLDFYFPIIALASFLVWIILIWLIDSQSSSSFFREYRWITSPAIILVIFLLGVSWAQAKLAEETIVRYAVSPFDVDGDTKVYIRYPQNIPVESTTVMEISIWSDKDWSGCASSITLDVSSAGTLLLLATPPESDKPAEWKDTMRVILKKDVRESVLMMKPAETPGEKSLLSNLSVKVNGTEENLGEAVTIESARAVQVRGWKSNFLASGSIMFSLAGAVLAWFKQKEEEKKKEQGERRKQFVGTFEEKAQKDFLAMLDELKSLLPTNEWESYLLNELKDKFCVFLEKKLWQVLSTLYVKDIYMSVERLLSVGTSIFGEAVSEEFVALKKLQESANSEEFAEILKKYPQGAAAINSVAKSRFGEPMTVNHERALREEQIRSWAKTASIDDPNLYAWLRAHRLMFSPFLDAESPFILTLYKSRMLLESNSYFDFSKDENIYKRPSLAFKNQWEANAGMFEYLKHVRTFQHQPFVVLAFSGIVSVGRKPHDHILQALSEAWLFEFVEDTTAFYALSEAERTLVGKLFLWRHDSSDSAIATIEAAFDLKLRALRGKKQEKNAPPPTKQENEIYTLVQKISVWLRSLASGVLKDGEIQTLLRIRPPAMNFTLFIDVASRMDGALTELPQMPDWKFVNIQISAQNPIRVEEKNLAIICRERIKICSQGQVNALEELCDPHDGPSADEILAKKAKGSPGEMVRLGQSWLLRHVEIHSLDDNLQIDELNDLA